MTSVLSVDSRPVWYRVTEICFAPPLDEFDEPRGRGRMDVIVMEYPVTRYTPKGVWLDLFGQARFVRTLARKRWACPTKAEAWESFKARKRRQRAILRAQLERVEECLAWEPTDV
jgi:hypothetical protein